MYHQYKSIPIRNWIEIAQFLNLW